MTEPKFKPGDLVAFRAACEMWRACEQPTCFMVTESHMQTCPGGTQVHYRLGGYSKPGESLTNEVELVAWDDPLVDEAFKKCREAKEAQQISRRKVEATAWRIHG